MAFAISRMFNEMFAIFLSTKSTIRLKYLDWCQHVIIMVLKTNPGVIPFLKKFLVQLQFLTDFYQVLEGFLSDLTGSRFPVEPVGPAGPVWFLKHR